MLAGKLYGEQFGLDVSFAEPMVGEPDEVAGSDLLEFAGVPVASFRVYPVETHIAEKLHAYTLPRPGPNSRIKDLPDLALLASTGEIDGSRLRAAVRQTFAHRGTHEVPESLPPPPDAWSEPYDRMARLSGLRWASIDALFGDVRRFVDHGLSVATTTWHPDTWAWDVAWFRPELEGRVHRIARRLHDRFATGGRLYLRQRPDGRYRAVRRRLRPANIVRMVTEGESFALFQLPSGYAR